VLPRYHHTLYDCQFGVYFEREADCPKLLESLEKREQRKESLERGLVLAKQMLSHLSYKPAAYSFHFNHLRTAAHRVFLKYFARAASGEDCPLIRDPCEPESRTEAWDPPKVYIRCPTLSKPTARQSSCDKQACISGSGLRARFCLGSV